jgi:hypothetical protein
VLPPPNPPFHQVTEEMFQKKHVKEELKWVSKKKKHVQVLLIASTFRFPTPILLSHPFSVKISLIRSRIGWIYLFPCCIFPAGTASNSC